MESGASRRWGHVIIKRLQYQSKVRAVSSYVPSTQGASPGYLKFAHLRRCCRLGESSGKYSRWILRC